MANGEFGGGNGTAASPYIIEDAFDLYAIRSNPSKIFELSQDIDLGINPFDTEEGWEPIGNFSGILYGNGHKIKNLYSNRPERDYVGLFGKIAYGGTIYDLDLENVDITGKNYVGALVGRHEVNATSRGIFRCSSSGAVKGDTCVGGIAGYFYGTYGYIQECYSKCIVSGEGDYVGGLTGRTYGSSSSSSYYVKVNKCLFYGEVISNNPNARCDIAAPYYTSISELYFLNKSNKLGSGTEVNEAELKTLDAERANFNTFHEGRPLWHFRPWMLPKFTRQVIPKENEPRVLLKNNGVVFTKDEDWVSLGSNLDEINAFEIGIHWEDLESTRWWENFEGPVDILLFSKTEDPSILIDIESYRSSHTDEDDLINIKIDALKPDKMTIEDKHLELKSEKDMDAKEGLMFKVGSMSHEAMDFDREHSLLMQGEEWTDFSIETPDAIVKVDSSETEEMELERTPSVLLEGIEATDATMSEGFDVNIDSGVVEEMSLDKDKSILMEGLKVSDNTISNGELNVSSAKSDNSEVEQRLNLIGESTSQIRAAISADDGRRWWVFDKNNEEWKQTSLQNLVVDGMDMELLHSLDYFDYAKLIPDRAYTRKIKVALKLSSTLDEENTTFRGLTFDYYKNQPAFIENAKLTPESIHNEYASLTFDLADLEGDEIFYKILVQRAGEEEFIQIEPSNGEWNKRKNGESVFHAYNHPYFNKGHNKIRVIAKDSRGESSHQDFDLYLVNEKPWVSIAHSRFGMDLVVGDHDLDSVSYKVEVNGETIVGFTDFQKAPVNFTYKWRPGQLKTDEDNLVRIEVVDSFGEKAVEEFTVQGHHIGLMFVDEHGEYLTNDLGELLKYLNFGPIVGGTISPTKAVRLRNELGVAVKDPLIKIYGEELSDGVTAELSKEEMPFVGSDRVRYEGIFPPQEERTVYVRVRSLKEVKGVNYFEGRATVDTDV